VIDGARWLSITLNTTENVRRIVTHIHTAAITWEPYLQYRMSRVTGKTRGINARFEENAFADETVMKRHNELTQQSVHKMMQNLSHVNKSSELNAIISKAQANGQLINIDAISKFNKDSGSSGNNNTNVKTTILPIVNNNVSAVRSIIQPTQSSLSLVIDETPVPKTPILTYPKSQIPYIIFEKI
jgi:hypothetical protein